MLVKILEKIKCPVMAKLKFATCIHGSIVNMPLYGSNFSVEELLRSRQLI